MYSIRWDIVECELRSAYVMFLEWFKQSISLTVIIEMNKMKMWMLVREQVHQRPTGDPHMDNGI